MIIPQYRDRGAIEQIVVKIQKGRDHFDRRFFRVAKEEKQKEKQIREEKLKNIDNNFIFSYYI